MTRSKALPSPTRLGALLGLAMITDAVGAARAADPAYGEYLSGECMACHRKDSQEKGIPAIVGWPAEQFIAVMHDYKSKHRTNPTMQTIAGRLSDDEIAALAAYWGGLKLRGP